MPVFKSRTAVGLARGVKAFLNIEVGVTRGEVPGAVAAPRLTEARPVKKLGRAGRRMLGKVRGVAEERALPVANDKVGRSGGVKPENMIWIFGTGRSGSTWLRSMMSEMKSHRVWEEPMVGKLFGEFYGKAQRGQLGSKNFIMGDPTRRGWIRSVRNFVLDGVEYAHPQLRPSDYLVIKEPNGTAGAPLLMEALPESRMICLIRDPRDVVASSLDAARKDSWLYERKSQGRWKERNLADTKPNAFVRSRADGYLRYVERAREAYEAHKGPKVLVRYEELLDDTLGTMKRIYSALEIPVEEQELARSMNKHSWQNIPAEKKGEGKFYRKATPGGWKEDLTSEQVRIVEKTTAPVLKEFYPV